jgi:hypothetical protein
MKRARAFTLIEALVVVVVIVLVAIMLIIPALPHQKQMADSMKNCSQMRTIINTFYMWSDANCPVTSTTSAASAPTASTFVGGFPGGIASAAGNYPANAGDPRVVARFWALIAAPGIDPLDPKMLVNPMRAGVPETIWSNPNSTIVSGVTSAYAVGFGSNNVSYALLSTKMGSEWRNNINASCPMICDRNRGTPAAPTSSWSTAGWVGGVAWGDCHTTWEHSPILEVNVYGNNCPTSNLWGPATSSNAGMLNPGF